jgi:hypothetical protein
VPTYLHIMNRNASRCCTILILIIAIFAVILTGKYRRFPQHQFVSDDSGTSRDTCALPTQFSNLLNNRYATLYSRQRRRPQRFFIGLNLYNSEHVVPVITEVLLKLVKALGKDNVFISIYENGSIDEVIRFLICRLRIC